MADNIDPAERFILDTLRMTSLRKMRDDDWAGLEKRVAQVGIARLDGWYGDQVRKAIRQIVAKHPGHADQSVHGGKKGGGAKSDSNADSPTSQGSTRESGGGEWSSQKEAEGARRIGDTQKTLTETSGNLESWSSKMRMATGDSDSSLNQNLNGAKMSLDSAKKQLDLAQKMQGVDRGTTQKHLRKAREHVREARKDVDLAHEKFSKLLPKGHGRISGGLADMELGISDILEMGFA